MVSKKRANETATSVRKDMRIDKELLENIDAVRGDVPFAAWVKRAIKMRLDALEYSMVDESIPVTNGAVITGGVRTVNEMRAKETKYKLFSSISALSHLEKMAILNARYPKSQCRKAINEIVSKDSIAKYWDEIQVALNS